MSSSKINKFTIAFLAALLATTSACAQEPPVKTVFPWYSNQTWNTGIKNSIKNYFGPLRGTFIASTRSDIDQVQTKQQIADSQLVSEQFLAAFNGVPMSKSSNKAGLTLYVYAMPHNAIIRAAVVTASPSPNDFAIKGAGLLHFSCGMVTNKSGNISEATRSLNYSKACTSKKNATIFFKSKDVADRDTVATLREWAEHNKVEDSQIRFIYLNEASK